MTTPILVPKVANNIGIERNEIAEKLAKKGPSTTFTHKSRILPCLGQVITVHPTKRRERSFKGTIMGQSTVFEALQSIFGRLQPKTL